MLMFFLTGVLGLVAGLLGGWLGLGIFLVAYFWGGVFTLYAGYTREAIRPQAEWSDKPVPSKDWVL